MADPAPSCPWCFERQAKPEPGEKGWWLCPCGKSFGVTEQDQQEAMEVEFDRYFPPRGPCAFCGHPDKRHRIIDVIAGRHKAGESLADLADDYDLPVEAMAAAVAREAQADYERTPRP